MVKKVYLLFSLLLAIMPFSAYAALSDSEFCNLCFSGSIEEIQDALRKGANPNAENQKLSSTALMSAMENEKAPQVINALIKAGANVNAKNSGGMTALMFAEDFEIVNALIKAGADVNARNVYNQTPLMRSMLMECTNVNNARKIINALLKAGADVNAKDKDGCTALMYAVYLDDMHRFVDTLLNAGADVNAENAFGWTALAIALECKKDYAAQRLKKFGGIEKGRIESRIVKLAEKGKLRELQEAIISGANVNAATLGGTTALMLAASENNLEAVNLLLKAKADVNSCDGDGETALMYALDNPNIVEVLLKAGADINIKDEDGCTALDIARNGKNNGVIKLLEAAARKQR